MTISPATAFSSNAPDPLVRSLLERLTAARARAAREGRAALALTTIDVTASGETIDRFAAGQRAFGDAVYFRAPGGRVELCGIGVAADVRLDAGDTISLAATRLRTIVSDAIPEDALPPVFIGGFAFDPSRPTAPEWAPFGAGRLVLPRMLLRVAGGTATLTVAASVTAADEPRALADRLAYELAAVFAPSPTAVAQVGSASFADDEADFADQVARTSAAIRAQAYDKVVLARRRAIHAPGAFDPIGTLRRLRERDPSAFTFAVTAGGRTFLGATPERLVGLTDGAFAVDCLAGTIARGRTAADDERLGRALFASAKDRREHAVVVTSVRSALAGRCSALEVALAPELRMTQTVQHLFTPVTGRVAGTRSVLDLVEWLHPTPAVGGAPRAGALAWIRATETFDRGWYAGPIGWVDGAGNGEFAVAIRSALVYDRDAWLYAGCGIMGDSQPEVERAEADLKFDTMMTALGVAW